MTINLIPPQSKKERQIKHTLGGIYFASVVILVFLLLISGFIYSTNFFVLSDIKNFNEKIAEKSTQISKYKELESSIRQANLKIETLKKNDSDRIVWSEILKELAKSTPPKIKINSLALDKTTKTVSLSGVANTRTDIADMKDELENSSLFRNAVFASSTYNTEDNNYTFTLDAELEAI